jgi:hypothetical protein
VRGLAATAAYAANSTSNDIAIIRRIISFHNVFANAIERQAFGPHRKR